MGIDRGRPWRLHRGVPTLTLLLLVLLLAAPAAHADPLVTQDLSSGLTANDLAQALAGSGVTISNVTYTGAAQAAGAFTGGTGIIAFDDGVVLSSGWIAGVKGPNNSSSWTYANGTSGDALLTALAGKPTYDAAILEFDFVPSADKVYFEYVFGSEEYNEYVNSQFNDVFAFHVNGVNGAVVGDPPVPVSINTINNGNPFGSTPNSHPELYVNNASGALNTQLDGLTKTLVLEATVVKDQVNHMRLAIADASDFALDSDVFIKAGSFGTEDPTAKPTSTTYTGAASVQYSDQLTLSGTLLDTSVVPNLAVAGKQLDFTLGTQMASAGPTDAAGSASVAVVVTQKPGSVATVATAFAGDASYEASSDSDAFAIAKEDCTIAYSGDTLVAPATATTLAADLGELDAWPGDLSGKTVVFSVTGVSTPLQTFTAVTDASGHAATSANLGPDVYAVSAAFAGDDYYTPCGTTAETLLTVQAATAKVTGGGWTSVGTGRSSFGLNAIPVAGGWKGQFQLRSNSGGNRFHSGVVTTLTSLGNTATWSGTGRWNGVSGYKYTISVVDNGSNNKRAALDTIAITITSPSGAVVFSTGGPQALKGGNLTIHQ